MPSSTTLRRSSGSMTSASAVCSASEAGLLTRHASPDRRIVPAAAPMPSSAGDACDRVVVARGDDARARRRDRAAPSPNGPGASGSATAKPASRTTSCAAAMSIERAPFGRRLATASTRPSASWHSASASEPSTRTRSTSPGQRRGGRREVLGARRLERDELQAGERARRAERRAVDGRAAAALARSTPRRCRGRRRSRARRRPSPARRRPRPRAQ